MAERQRDYRKALKTFIHRKTGGKCGYCGTGLPEKGFSVDHIDPYGPDDVDNYMASCRSCNSRKGQKSLEEYRDYITGVQCVKDRHPEVALPGPVAVWLSKQEWYPHEIIDHVFHFEVDAD